MVVYTKSQGGIRLEINDNIAHIDPRETESHIGTMVCFHKRYDLGDKHSFENKDEFLTERLAWHFKSRDKAELCMEKLDDSISQLLPGFAADKMRDYALLELLKEDHVFLPLYLLDHSGLSMSTGSYNDKWDSGQVGWIYADKDTVVREYGEWSKESREKVAAKMKNEVRAYDAYLRGEVYLYDYFDELTGEREPGGFYIGDLEDAKKEAEAALPEEMSGKEMRVLQAKLREKMRGEYDAYINEIKQLSVPEVIDLAYPITMKSHMADMGEECRLPRREFEALLAAPCALDAAYEAWLNLDASFDREFEISLHMAGRDLVNRTAQAKGDEAR